MSMISSKSTASGCRATSGSSVNRAVVTPSSRKQAGQRRTIARRKFRRQGVPALPVGTVKTIQIGRIDQRLVEDERLAGQPIDRGRLDPRIAVSPKIARVQSIENQTDCIHAAILTYLAPGEHTGGSSAPVNTPGI